MFPVEASGAEKGTIPSDLQASKSLRADRTQGQAVNVPPVVKNLRQGCSATQETITLKEGNLRHNHFAKVFKICIESALQMTILRIQVNTV